MDLLQHGCDGRDIVKVAAIAVVDAQRPRGEDEVGPAAPEAARTARPQCDPVA